MLLDSTRFATATKPDKARYSGSHACAARSVTGVVETEEAAHRFAGDRLEKALAETPAQVAPPRHVGTAAIRIATEGHGQIGGRIANRPQRGVSKKWYGILNQAAGPANNRDRNPAGDGVRAGAAGGAYQRVRPIEQFPEIAVHDIEPFRKADCDSRDFVLAPGGI